MGAASRKGLALTTDTRDQEFVPLRTLVANSGLLDRTIRRHIRLLGIALYEDPQDRRARMIRAEDAARLRSLASFAPRTNRLLPNTGARVRCCRAIP
jgi:hypothetical protein